VSLRDAVCAVAAFVSSRSRDLEDKGKNAGRRPAVRKATGKAHDEEGVVVATGRVRRGQREVMAVGSVRRQQS
jgi:hypothetical protein